VDGVVALVTIYLLGASKARQKSTNVQYKDAADNGSAIS
jgi:hypothetical protein